MDSSSGVVSLLTALDREELDGGPISVNIKVPKVTDRLFLDSYSRTR